MWRVYNSSHKTAVFKMVPQVLHIQWLYNRTNSLTIGGWKSRQAGTVARLIFFKPPIIWKTSLIHVEYCDIHVIFFNNSLSLFRQTCLRTVALTQAASFNSSWVFLRLVLLKGMSAGRSQLTGSIRVNFRGCQPISWLFATRESSGICEQSCEAQL